MFSSCAACGSPASIAPSRFLCPSTSIRSPSLAACKILRNLRVLGLGFSCAGDVLREISSGAPQPLGVLYLGAPGSRGGAYLPFFRFFAPFFEAQSNKSVIGNLGTAI